MIKYVKLREETEMPCMVCGSDSRIFIVKNMKHTKQNSFYICEKCFKSFKKDGTVAINDIFLLFIIAKISFGFKLCE